MIENTLRKFFQSLPTIKTVRVVKHWPSPMVARKANIDLKFRNKRGELLRGKFK